MAQNIKSQLDLVKQREQIADSKRSGAGNILNLGDVLGLPPTRAERVLSKINQDKGAMTEALQLEDLKRFETSMRGLQDEFKRLGVQGGIHPRTVINKSLKVDIKRCQDEITLAAPVRHDRNGTVVFRTNASHKSGDSHHIVTVEFLNFQAALAGGNITNELANQVSRGAIRFDCDCGRHRFWYRYIASVGGYAQGKPETGFPKVRNPNTKGIACKHALRVMLVLTKSPSFTKYMKDYLAKYRQNPVARAKTAGKRQADKMAQTLAKESWNGKAVRRRKNAVPPADIRAAFKAGAGQSIAGTGMSPADLAKAKGKAMSASEVAREIKRSVDSGKLSAEQVSAIQKILEGGQ